MNWFCIIQEQYLDNLAINIKSMDDNFEVDIVIIELELELEWCSFISKK